jgi:hypothetical protein
MKASHLIGPLTDSLREFKDMDSVPLLKTNIALEMLQGELGCEALCGLF